MRGLAVAKSVDAYLKSARPEVRQKLEQLRAIFRSVAPKAEEVISYGMPYYKQDGALGGFALFKNHIGFFPGAIVKDFQNELAGYRTSKGTIQLPLDKPLPVALIRKILRVGLSRNAAKKAKKKSNRSTPHPSTSSG